MNNQLTTLITAGKTKEAIAFLRKQSLPNSVSKKLNLIEAEFNKLREEETKGVITFEEKQLRRNRVNDKLLSLFENDAAAAGSSKFRNWLLLILPLILLVLGSLFWSKNNTPTYECPKFPTEFNNKILILPFENVGSETARPHVILRDKINTLTAKNNLSSVAKPCSPIANVTIAEAPEIAQECEANLLIWGNYSARTDSIRMTLNYYFTDTPEESKLGEMLALKDVTGLQSGKMLKNLDDAILSLCGIIAVREGNEPIAKKWFEKVKKKEDFDREILGKLK